MSDHHLPDDVRRWPHDAYALLGVSFDVSPRDLKKAYARLIRTFRPEDFPEQFRRIRDAFELLQQRAKWNVPPPQPLSGDPMEGDMAPPPRPRPIFSDDSINADVGNLPFHLYVPPPPPRKNPEPLERFPLDLELDKPASETVPRQLHMPQSGPSETARLWQLACSGEEDQAYRGLREFHNRNPRDPEAALMLYWMLNVFSDLDRVRHPCDWLAESLRNSGLASPGRELYRRYVVNHPEEALSERYTQMLECPGPAIYVAQLLEWRWRAAGQLRDPHVIARDLNALGPRLVREDEEGWARLLFFAADELAWLGDDAQSAFRRCQADLEAMVHLQSRMADAFARLDFLKELSEAWRRETAPHQLTRLCALVPLSWIRPLPEARLHFLRFLSGIWEDRRAALETLDQLQQRAPILLSHLTQIMETMLFSLPRSPLSFATDDEVEQRTRHFLSGVDSSDYPSFRWTLLKYCCREYLAPERMAEVMERRSNETTVTTLFGVVRNDWPLRWLCVAHRLFWA